MNEMRKRRCMRKVTLLLVSFVAAFAAALTLLYLVGNRIEQAGNAQARGDLSTRFEEPRRMEYNGRLYQYRSKITTILVMGTDTSGQDNGISALRNGGQADFLLLMVIDDQRKTITPIQIDRDTMAEITVTGVMGDSAGTRIAQICLAHGFGDGGEESCLYTATAVGGYLKGAVVDFYVAVNLTGIALINDMLGGVTVTLKDDFTALDPAMKKGATLRLKGKQAEYYVRNRMGIGIGTNEARMERQRSFLAEALRLLDAKLEQDSGFAGTLYDALESCMFTNMRRGRMINEAYASRHYQREETVVPAGTHEIGADGFMEFHPDTAALEALVTDVFYEPLPG